MRAAPPNAGTFAIGAASALSALGAGSGEDRDAARRATCANAERLERQRHWALSGARASGRRGDGGRARATRVVVRSSAHASREREASAALLGAGEEAETEAETEAESDEDDRGAADGRRDGADDDSEPYGDELEDEEAYLSYGRSETASVRDLSISADDGYRTP